MTPLVLLLALAAPAPTVKPPPPPPAILPGAYWMVWQGTECETHFHADGAFACRWLGSWWQGRWSQQKGTLSVEESPLGDPVTRIRWDVKLAGPMAGTMGAHAWKLSPWAGSRVD